jgi:succinate dehydrogenase/fumarate reductase flavoprotein subunit
MMNAPDPEPTGSPSRRELFQLAALSAATAGMMPDMLWAGVEPAANPGATSLSHAGQKRIATDVLVIGGGMAGTFAAVTARAKGLNVALADKGTVGKSGCTPWARGFAVFDGEAGDNKSQWIENVSRNGEYINNRDSLDALMTDSLARYNDLVSWGAIQESIVNHGPVLREKLLASGVHLIERAMMTHLLLHDGRAAGAMGFSLDDEEAVVITAKAVILCAGSGGFKLWGFPISSLTSDGDAMAYRAGAIITGREFNDFHFTSAKYPASCWNNWSHEWRRGIARTSYGRGGGGPGGSPALACAFLADAGKAPVSLRALRPSGGPGGGPGAGGDVLGAGTGMSIHKAEGIWPADTQGGTNVPGLFAAGDGLGSMLCGAKYAGIGFSLCGSAVQGARAGQSAAAYAAQAGAPAVAEDQIAGVRAALFTPRERKSGFAPAWITQVLQNAMFPYFVLYIKKKERLEGALTTIEFLRDRLAPLVMAKDAHELRLAHETMNMILNAEMKLRAALFRTESRGAHYREDYPARDDANWLAWVKLQRGADGKMLVVKQEIPAAWKPSAQIPYEQRYRGRFPGEMEFIQKRKA